jgi:hypothetical protein
LDKQIEECNKLSADLKLIPRTAKYSQGVELRVMRRDVAVEVVGGINDIKN